MAEPSVCPRFVVPWDEQQGFNPTRDGDVSCDACGRPHSEHKVKTPKPTARNLEMAAEWYLDTIQTVSSLAEVIAVARDEVRAEERKRAVRIIQHVFARAKRNEIMLSPPVIGRAIGEILRRLREEGA